MATFRLKGFVGGCVGLWMFWEWWKFCTPGNPCGFEFDPDHILYFGVFLFVLGFANLFIFDGLKDFIEPLQTIKSFFALFHGDPFQKALLLEEEKEEDDSEELRAAYNDRAVTQAYYALSDTYIDYDGFLRNREDGSRAYMNQTDTGLEENAPRWLYERRIPRK